METYDEGTSLAFDLDFYDETGSAVIPETMDIIIRNMTTGKVIRRETVTPSSSSYTVNVTVAENTLQSRDSNEGRKLIAKWSYSNGTKGAPYIKEYTLEAL